MVGPRPRGWGNESNLRALLPVAVALNSVFRGKKKFRKCSRPTWGANCPIDLEERAAISKPAKERTNERAIWGNGGLRAVGLQPARGAESAE